MINLCAPSIIYLLFSITQILIDTYKGLYNAVFVKIIVTIMVTLLLNILCEKGLSIISWIIVFIPFILMTVIVSVILYTFGLKASTGELNSKKSENKYENITLDALGNVVIYDPNYDSVKNPVYYKSPNIIVPNPYNQPKISHKNPSFIVLNQT